MCYSGVISSMRKCIFWYYKNDLDSTKGDTNIPFLSLAKSILSSSVSDKIATENERFQNILKLSSEETLELRQCDNKWNKTSINSSFVA